MTSLMVGVIRRTAAGSSYQNMGATIAPPHCGNPHLSSNPSTISLSLFPLGKLTNCPWVLSRAQQTSHTHMDTVDLPMPNNSESVLKSVPDARHHNNTPILFSRGMAMRISVFCRWRSGRSFQHKMVNVRRSIRKFASHC